ncbi:DUF6648 family protein [uncultured Helcococcus sp.]|uniref:DUF6648 family protein n=1 Tax=uncultured Helcococcus sp. TaxID=1072508 RepID=UPI002611C977|nr:DUF6648 family protein [uncultured Helcococcus sp.]
MCKSEKDKLDRFIELRNLYIDLLENKSINKQEFNHKNNEIFQLINLRPFVVLDSFEKALYNYNYYNSKAKLDMENYNRHRNSKNNRKARIALNNCSNNYCLKDDSVMAMISLESPQYIDAYYINMQSKKLADQIFEINFTNKYRIILHTKNIKIKNTLEAMGCFDEKYRDSLIASYVNN